MNNSDEKEKTTYDHDVIKEMSLPDLHETYQTLSDEILKIELQLETADIEEEYDGKTINKAWQAKAKQAMKIRQRFKEYVVYRISVLEKEEKDAISFMEAAKKELSEETLASICQSAGIDI
jgi:hypothetical protein